MRRLLPVFASKRTIAGLGAMSQRCVSCHSLAASSWMDEVRLSTREQRHFLG